MMLGVDRTVRRSRMGFLALTIAVAGSLSVSCERKPAYSEIQTKDHSGTRPQSSGPPVHLISLHRRLRARLLRTRSNRRRPRLRNLQRPLRISRSRFGFPHSSTRGQGSSRISQAFKRRIEPMLRSARLAELSRGCFCCQPQSPSR